MLSSPWLLLLRLALRNARLLRPGGNWKQGILVFARVKLSGWKPKVKSCLVDLIAFYDEIRSSVGVVYLDINKAFNTVCPDILIDKPMRCA